MHALATWKNLAHAANNRFLHGADDDRKYYDSVLNTALQTLHELRQHYNL